MASASRNQHIQDIATSWAGDRAVVAHSTQHVRAWESRTRVTVWDLRRRRKISEFDTIMDFGGSRLAITPDGKRVIAAAYHVNGIACYEADTGAMLWQRKDLKKTQRVSINHTGDMLFASRQYLPAEALNLNTGEDVGSMDGIMGVACSPFADVRLIEFEPPDVTIVTPNGKWEVEKKKPLICAAFSPTTVAFSEMGGPVRCFDLADGRELWRFEGRHLIDISYVQRPAIAAAVTYAHTDGRPTTTLIFLDRLRGTLIREKKLTFSWRNGFCFRGTRLVTEDGSILETVSGKRLAKLPFSRTGSGAHRP